MDEEVRLHNMLRIERDLWDRGFTRIAGVDEAGRGPLAGPVVAAAVMFEPGVRIQGVRDSKKLSRRRRESLLKVIERSATAIRTGIVDHGEIDRINILRATYKAMRMAIEGLPIPPDHVLVDGRPIPDATMPQLAVVGGDRECFSIAAASIVAKVTRDRIMDAYDTLFPEYGFVRHKGYGTKEHVSAIRKHGLCVIHRKTFSIRGWEGCRPE